MAHLIDGRSLAAEIREQVKNAVKKATKTPRLAVILVGDDPASTLYVSLKEKAAKEVGIAFEKFTYAHDVSEAQLIADITRLNKQTHIDAILVQLPLPEHIHTDRVIATIDPKKDADGFHPDNLKSWKENDRATPPVLVEVITTLLHHARSTYHNRTAVILANSNVFADPLVSALERMEIAVSTCIRPLDMFDVTEKIRNADIVISALGEPHVLTGDIIKDNAIVIDVGTTRVNDKILGDVKADDFEHRNIWLTPVPGGVGPMTVAVLFKRTLELAEKR